MLKPIKRALHFDFHTMPGIDDFAENFSAEELAKQLGIKTQYITRILRGEAKTHNGWTFKYF